MIPGVGKRVCWSELDEPCCWNLGVGTERTLTAHPEAWWLGFYDPAVRSQSASDVHFYGDMYGCTFAHLRSMYSRSCQLPKPPHDVIKLCLCIQWVILDFNTVQWSTPPISSHFQASTRARKVSFWHMSCCTPTTSSVSILNTPTCPTQPSTEHGTNFKVRKNFFLLQVPLGLKACSSNVAPSRTGRQQHLVAMLV
jgi:hypothetical protein